MNKVFVVESVSYNNVELRINCYRSQWNRVTGRTPQIDEGYAIRHRSFRKDELIKVNDKFVEFLEGFKKNES